MPPAANAALADRLARIIEALCDAVARRVGRGMLLGSLAGPLIILIRARLRRIAARFTRLATRPAALAPAPSRLKAMHAASPPPRRPSPPLDALRGFAALLRLVPETAPLAAQLRHLLAEPEMKALLDAAPELGGTLRPLCRMLGIRPAQLPLPPPSGRAAASHPLSPGVPPIPPPSLVLPLALA